ncbi:MAG: kinetochore-associated Ndc80 complex subunit spc24 [Thelocarpon superellum]|nr:MAG: kinetochore-associated Ndc80 complex subunit spc24 [Thelocarpon superellum]
MLLDEDPATLIRHTIGNFNIHPDKSALGRINDSLSTLQQARDLRLREAESAMKKLSRNLATLQHHHDENKSSHSSHEHASQILALDTQKFRVAKSAADLEIESERCEQELDTLKARLADLDLQGVDGGETERGKRELEDEVLLKLKVYRSLGIDIEADGTGAYNKAVIRNNRKGDVHVVNVDPKFSRFFYANYFWQSI